MQRMATAVLISGHGSNLQALIDAAVAPDYPARMALVISNVANAYGLKRAQAAEIEALSLPHDDFATREAFEAALDDALRARQIGFVCLAGFMRVLTPGFVARWAGRMINIHPSLLPAYPGLHTHTRALADGASAHGATVHWVTAELDCGPVIAQASLTIAPDDTPETLRQRVHALEHQLYPRALALAIGQLHAR